MARPSSPHRLKRWIALNLRQLRKDAGFSRPEAAKRLGVSRTAIGHLESARNLPSQPALEILLGYYGVPERFADFAALVEAARKGKNWWNHLAGAVPPWFDEYLGFEAGAAELRVFETYVMAGLLQTEDYARAVVRADRSLTEGEINQRVQLRTERQAILARDDGDEDEDAARLWVVLDESVLYRRRGTREVMAEQLAHLTRMSEYPRITVQVLPLDAGAHEAQQGSFQLIKFPAEFVGDPGVAYLDEMPEGHYHEEPDSVAKYERAFTNLQVLAATPEDSRTLIQKALKEISP
ncbi:helix-turn-helix protein [Tamaricihabitans halophyticus]|uniref:Helix-turn-helix protein n=1 Tax=Tamaricihabitans halophyticus TaxID=1262583 RepID=A0A4R2R3P9_9PSEU|nr:helix-turn-helix transcriptional regulator [Tamaricihabitans halophyticus]TCP57462.1 helix-turn-helix protein [Tamaricihabitans halophyticus]